MSECKNANMSWGPKGIEFARFHLNGSQDVVIYGPEPGGKAVNLELWTSDLECELDGGTPKPCKVSAVLHLPKARARALASAIMGAAAEL